MSQTSGQVTLARLLDLLGAATVDSVDAPRGLDVPVAGPRLYDPADPTALGPDEVVLAVNLDAGSPAAAVAVAESAQARATALALKGDRDQITATLVPLARSRGLALLLVEPDATWDQLYTLIRSAVNSAGPPGDGDETPLGDLFALANALAAAIGGAVTIEDADTTLLAYSNLDQPIDDARRDTILGRRTPGRWAAVLEEEGIPQQLLASSGRAVRVHDPNEQARDRLVIAIRAGVEMVGTIWVVEGDRRLDDRAAALLEDAAPLAALHLLRHRAADDLHRTERSRLLQALLEGQRSAAEVSTSLGVESTTRCTIVNFHVTGDSEVDAAVRRARAADLIMLACDSYRRRVICTTVGNSVYALFPATDGDDSLDVFIEDVTARATSALGVRVTAGIGSTVPRLSAIAGSRTDADRAVRVLMRSTPQSERLTARIDDVRVPSILLEIGDLLATRPDLALPALDQLADYDSAHAKEYLPTLHAMAAASWDITAAARVLNLHPNSLRYRLKRLEEITGLQLDDAAHRLVISLHLLTGPAAAV